MKRLIILALSALCMVAVEAQQPKTLYEYTYQRTEDVLNDKIINTEVIANLTGDKYYLLRDTSNNIFYRVDKDGNSEDPEVLRYDPDMNAYKGTFWDWLVLDIVFLSRDAKRLEVSPVIDTEEITYHIYTLTTTRTVYK